MGGFGGVVAKALGLALLFLAGALVVAIFKMWPGVPADAPLKALTIDVLLPVFQAVATVVVAAGFLKGVATAVNNHAPGTREPIDFFKW